MKRVLSIGILCVLAALLQTTVLSYVEVASIRPDLPVILTASFALMCGSRSGLWIGFVSGLLLDIFGGGILGFHALILSWIGYTAGYTYRIFYDDDIKTPLLLVSLGDLAYGCAVYVLQFLIRGRVHFFFYLNRIMIPEMLYTIFLTFPVYRLFYRIEHSLAKSDKRSMNGFV